MSSTDVENTSDANRIRIVTPVLVCPLSDPLPLAAPTSVEATR